MLDGQACTGDLCNIYDDLFLTQGAQGGDLCRSRKAAIDTWTMPSLQKVLIIKCLFNGGCSRLAIMIQL